MRADLYRSLLCIPVYIFYCCSGTSISGDIDADAADAGNSDLTDSSMVTDSADTPWYGDVNDDWEPDPGSGSLIPADEGSWHGSPLGVPVELYRHEVLAADYSGSSYGLFLVERRGSLASIGVYILDPARADMEKAWSVDEPNNYAPSICWTGDIFAAALADASEGISLVPISSDGGLSGSVDIFAELDTSDVIGWTNDVANIYCPANGPLFIYMPFNSMTRPDDLYKIVPDGRVIDEPLEVYIPEPDPTAGQVPSCATIGDAVACPTAEMEKPRIAFFNRDGDVWESAMLPPSTSFADGIGIADSGGIASVFWIETDTDTEVPQLSYSLLSSEGDFIIEPRQTGVLLDSVYQQGIYAASSGEHCLVVTKRPSDAETGAKFVFLLDLRGNLLDDPIELDPDERVDGSIAVFWDGTGYSVLWASNDGIMLRRFFVM